MNRSQRPCSFFCSSLLLLLLIFPSSVFSDTTTTTTLTPFEIDYDIDRSGMVIIHMQRRLRQLDNGEYRFESTSRPAKTISWLIKDRISEHSRWHYHQQQPRPLHYHYQRSRGKKNKHIELAFDWQQGRVSDSKRRPAWSSDIAPQTTDKLLYQLQLMLDLQAGKKKLSYTIADSGKIRHYDFTRVGTETIHLPLGRFKTIKLHRSSGERSTTIWCAPVLNYLPIRIEHTGKDGRRTRADATRVKGLPFKQKTKDKDF